MRLEILEIKLWTLGFIQSVKYEDTGMWSLCLSFPNSISLIFSFSNHRNFIRYFPTMTLHNFLLLDNVLSNRFVRFFFSHFSCTISHFSSSKIIRTLIHTDRNEVIRNMLRKWWEKSQIGIRAGFPTYHISHRVI